MRTEKILLVDRPGPLRWGDRAVYLLLGFSAGFFGIRLLEWVLK